jgi:hypothetical protein
MTLALLMWLACTLAAWRMVRGELWARVVLAWALGGVLTIVFATVGAAVLSLFGLVAGL